MITKQSPLKRSDLFITLINGKPYFMICPSTSRSFLVTISFYPEERTALDLYDLTDALPPESAQDGLEDNLPLNEMDVLDLLGQSLEQLNTLIVGLFVHSAFRKMDNKLYQRAPNFNLRD